MEEIVQQQQPISQNNIPSSPRSNLKYILLVSLVVIIFIILVAIIISANTKTNEAIPQTLSNPTSTPQRVNQPINTQTSSTPSQQEALIRTEVNPQLDQIIQPTFSISKVKTYEQDWAIVQVSGKDIDNAYAVTHRENGTWKVKLGPGTFFEEATLKQIGAPSTLANDINNGI